MEFNAKGELVIDLRPFLFDDSTILYPVRVPQHIMEQLLQDARERGVLP